MCACVPVASARSHCTRRSGPREFLSPESLGLGALRSRAAKPPAPPRPGAGSGAGSGAGAGAGGGRTASALGSGAGARPRHKLNDLSNEDQEFFNTLLPHRNVRVWGCGGVQCVAALRAVVITTTVSFVAVLLPVESNGTAAPPVRFLHPGWAAGARSLHWRGRQQSVASSNGRAGPVLPVGRPSPRLCYPLCRARRANGADGCGVQACDRHCGTLSLVHSTARSPTRGRPWLTVVCVCPCACACVAVALCRSAWRA